MRVVCFATTSLSSNSCTSEIGARMLALQTGQNYISP